MKSTGTKSVSAGTSPEHTDRIIQCHHPEIGPFYINAASCDAADPRNRISIAEPLHTAPGQDQYSGQNFTNPRQDAGNSRTEECAAATYSVSIRLASESACSSAILPKVSS